MKPAHLLLALLFALQSTAWPDSPAIIRDCIDCPELLLVPAGSFRLGSSLDEYEHDESSGETPTLEVRIREPFAIGRFEISRAEFTQFLQRSGYLSTANGACQTTSMAPGAPVSCVALKDITAYLAWLSKLTARPYRLPSEAEWEYAARAGTVGARFWSNRDSHEGVSISRACDYGNVFDVTGRALAKSMGASGPHARCADGYVGLAPVGSFQANAFGLYDTAGNVRERVADCFTRSYKGRPADQRAWIWTDCSHYAVRGGSYLTRPFAVRSAARDYIDARSGVAPDIGFRIARALNPTEAAAAAIAGAVR